MKTWFINWGYIVLGCLLLMISLIGNKSPNVVFFILAIFVFAAGSKLKKLNTQTSEKK